MASGRDPPTRSSSRPARSHADGRHRQAARADRRSAAAGALGRSRSPRAGGRADRRRDHGRASRRAAGGAGGCRERSAVRRRRRATPGLGPAPGSPPWSARRPTRPASGSCSSTTARARPPRRTWSTPSSRRPTGTGRRSRSCPSPRRSSASRTIGSTATVDRSDLVAAQTPQGVRRDAPPRGARVRGRRRRTGTWTDEAALLEACTIAVHVVPGDPANLKVTVPADLARAAALAGAVGPARGAAIGHDSHPFGPGAPLRSAASRSPARRASTATPTATSRCTRSPMRCSGRPRSATSGGCSRRTGDAARASTAASCSTTVVAPARRRRLAAGRGRPDDRRRTAPARPGISTRCAAAIAAGLGLPPEAVEREGVDGQPRRRRGRRTADLRTRARDDRADPMSDLRLLDTLSGETRPLVPLEARPFGIYSCGPTVYGPAHIGNFRSFLFADLLVRYLRWRGLPGPLGDEHHRHRRQDHQGRRRCRARPSASWPIAISRGSWPTPRRCA